MECKRRRCQYSTAQVTKISAVSVWPLLSPGPAENSAEYWRQENSLPFPSPIWRGLFQGVFNSYTSKLYFKLIWQLHVIPRAERHSLSQEGELHNQRCAGGGDAGRASKMPSAACYRETAMARNWRVCSGETQQSGKSRSTGAAWKPGSGCPTFSTSFTVQFPCSHCTHPRLYSLPCR